MKPVRHARVKVCCISSLAEAELAVRQGASALGLVSAMPSGPGVIDDSLIAEIAAVVPAGVARFLLTSRTNPLEIVAQQRAMGVDTLQMVDRVDEGGLRHIREALPGVRLVQVIHVTGPESLDEARALAPLVDGLLLDSGRPDLAVKELGGTGRVHDWELSREIRRTVAVPIFLAGGLNPSNVRDAIERVAPFGVDLCSGVRTNGHLDEEKLTAFMNAVRA